MATAVRSPIIQITNISPAASTDQLKTLFGHIGVLGDFIIYSNDEQDDQLTKVGYIRYEETINAEVALHLNNTVFLDRALIVLPLANAQETIPDEKIANMMRAPPNTAAGVLPRTAEWPLDVISMVVGRPGEQVINTVDPRLSTLAFPLYPPLPATTDGNRIEEIRRTILVTNLDPKTTGDQVLEFFNKHTEVRCVRMAGTEMDRAAYVEFTHQPSIVKAFGLMGATLNGRQIMVQHSNCAIIKPVNPLGLVENPSRRAVELKTEHKKHDRYRSRSRSPRRTSPKHKRNRSRDRRRSRSRHGRRSRSHGRKRHSRSVSRDRRRINHCHSGSKERKKYHRSRSRSDKHRSSRSRSHGRRGDRRDRDKDRDSGRNGRDRIRERDRKDKDSEKERYRDKDRRKESRSSRKHDDSPRANISTCEEKKVAVSPSGVDELYSTQKSHRGDESITNRASSVHSDNNDNECGLSNEKTNDQKSINQNGDLENEITPCLPIDEDTVTRPVVLGVKLAGPEDMDPSFAYFVNSDLQQSPASHSTASSDAMDTEA